MERRGQLIQEAGDQSQGETSGQRSAEAATADTSGRSVACWCPVRGLDRPLPCAHAEVLGQA